MVKDAPDEGRREGESPSDDFDARLERARKEAQPPMGNARPTLLGLAFRLTTELVAGVVVGLAIGFVLDRWLGTSPWLTLVFFFLGTGAGFLNVTRTAREMNADAAKGAAERKDEED